ncbi:hypothetical protein LTR53_012241 [Teratosphaeriaceae sp. CCFEE 6253]|nr:hypothetical protein LTR53_012241 [Teratosphaeriaceae sp. CCFEE 6253]
MAPTPFRPWNKSLLTAGVLVCTLLVLFLLHHEAGTTVPSSQAPSNSAYEDSLDLSAPSPHPTAHTKTPAKRKAIITSVQRKDETTADWLVDLLPGWETSVYVTDRTSDEAPLPNTSPIEKQNLPVNRGREASVYLTYIIHHYYDLPDYMVFIHGKRYQIHNDDPMLDTFPEIDRLNLDYVAAEGYTALRCNWMHCPRAQVEPELGFADGFWDTRGLYAAAWEAFFPNTTIPTSVTGPCCAQFAVTRAVVRRWPLDKYEQIRQWMWAQEGDEASMKSGLVLEYMWHILFGKPAYFCPDVKECYCKKWGLCDLDCEREGWCLGRIWLNPQKNPPMGLPKSIPDNWPAEGQGGKGQGGHLPYEGWWNDQEELQDH